MMSHTLGVFVMLALVCHNLIERALVAAYHYFAPAFVAKLELTPSRHRHYFAVAAGLAIALVTSPWFVWLSFFGRPGVSQLHGWTVAGLAPVAIRAAQFCRETDTLREYTTLMLHHAMSLAAIFVVTTFDICPVPVTHVFAGILTDGLGNAIYLARQHGQSHTGWYGALLWAKAVVFLPPRVASMIAQQWLSSKPAPGDELTAFQWYSLTVLNCVYAVYCAHSCHVNCLKLRSWQRTRRALAANAADAAAVVTSVEQAAQLEAELVAELEAELEAADSLLPSRWASWAMSGDISLAAEPLLREEEPASPFCRSCTAPDGRLRLQGWSRARLGGTSAGLERRVTWANIVATAGDKKDH